MSVKRDFAGVNFLCLNGVIGGWGKFQDRFIEMHLFFTGSSRDGMC